MRVVAYGDIMDEGRSAFTSVAKVDGSSLLVSFDGEIRIDDPYGQLQPYLGQLNEVTRRLQATRCVLDFTRLSFCNSNGFYVIMDVAELIYAATSGPVLVVRSRGDDWQQETLPILIDIDNAEVAERTTFEDRMAL